NRIERAGKSAAELGGQLRGGEEGRPAFAKGMAERAHRDAGPRGAIGDDDVHAVQRELGEELLYGLVRPADDLDPLAEPKGGLEKPAHQRGGKDVRNADDQPQRLSA